MKCKICNNQESNVMYHAREMLLGTREYFDYMECSQCKCVQLIDAPEDMSPYYPSNYLTAKSPDIHDFSELNRADETIYIEQCMRIIKRDFLSSVIKTLDCSVLDVGCGAARVIRNLAAIGIKRAVGIDAFLFSNHVYESDNCKVYHSDIFNMTEKFDVIIMEHSLEHMDCHKEVLLKAYELLNEHGVLIFTIPIASYAWNIYRVHWFHMDAPRHLILHSFKSLELLIGETEFEIDKFYTEGKSLSLFYSELYKKDISGEDMSKRKIMINDYFTQEQQQYFIRLNEELNEECLGDIMTIFLRK